MFTFLLIVISIFLGLVMGSLMITIWAHWMHIPPQADEIYLVETGDGSRITIYRYKPENGSGNGRDPLLLCHGLMSNHHSFDLGDQPGSLAPWLRDKGYDVWVLELRGRMFHKPRPFAPRNYNWSFSNYVRYDAPRAIEFVLEKTGARKLGWVGHSMGGMIGFCMAMGPQSARLHTLATIGSPSDFRDMKTMRGLSRFFLRAYTFPMIPTGLLIRALAPILALYNSQKLSYFANAENFSYREKLLVLGNALGNLSTELLREFARAVVNHNFVSNDGFVNFHRDFHNINLPVLFMAGGRDELVPAGSVRWGYENCGSTDKEWIMFSRAEGYSRNIGHGDLILSSHARREVFTKLESFLNRTMPEPARFFGRTGNVKQAPSSRGGLMEKIRGKASRLFSRGENGRGRDDRTTTALTRR